MSAREHLFLQVLQDVKHLLRLNLRLAKGETTLLARRDQLANALQVKRALLTGLETASEHE